MEFLTAIFTALAAKVLEVVASLLCRPCNDEIQNSIQVLSKPESLDDYLRNLSDMANKIKAMSCSDEINNWVLEADKILRESSLSNHNDDQRSSCFFGNACLRCKLQKKIKKMIVRGNTIITRATLLPKRVEQIYGVPNIEDGTTVGRNLKRVIAMLEDDDVCWIGIWGPGGVGKTTLVEALNNRLNSTSFFSLVIYIQITKDADVKEMQKAITQRLDLEVGGRDNRYVAEQIRNRLQKEKFLLIVDNVWKFVDLPSIGIPKRQAESKIVLTTRLLDVCEIMEAKPFKIGYLTDEEAWQLFVEKAGDVAEKEYIRPLAEVVCRECGCLPLALVVVGSAMKGKTDVHLWQSAIDDLQCSIPISGVESRVYNALRFSHDWLESDTLRSCFFYCSLYPEGYHIDVSELIQCWLAEKVIDEQLHYRNAFCKGLDLIKKLSNSSLLEEFYHFGELRGVKLHDVVRDFARWTTELKGRSIIFSGHGISRGQMVMLPEPEKVESLQWISFVDNKQIELPQQSQDFPKVSTLLLHGTSEHEIKLSHEFLSGFQSLRVLNVRYLQSFSGSSLCLPEIRTLILMECTHVEEIACMFKLIILDLSGSSLHKIPRGVTQLTHLKVLNLSRTTSLKSVEVEIISNLNFLEVLDMRMSGYKWPTRRKSNSEEATLQDLSRLKELKSIYLCLADMECSYEDCNWMSRLENYIYDYGFDSDRVCLTKGKEINISRIRHTEVGSFILHAESLYLENIQNVNMIFANFNSIDQSNSKLKNLCIDRCSFSEEFTGLDPSHIAQSNLERLSLWDNNNVRSFSQIINALGTTFPKLRCLKVTGHMRWGNDGDEKRKSRHFFSFDDAQMEFPKLEEFHLSYYQDMIEVFHYGPAKGQPVAPNLRILKLYSLLSLQRLCDYEPMEQWRSLEILDVHKCPKLKKLPHMTSIKEIKGEEEWWNNLEWDSPETKSYMNQFFEPWPVMK